MPQSIQLLVEIHIDSVEAYTFWPAARTEAALGSSRPLVPSMARTDSEPKAANYEGAWTLSQLVKSPSEVEPLASSV